MEFQRAIDSAGYQIKEGESFNERINMAKIEAQLYRALKPFDEPYSSEYRLLPVRLQQARDAFSIRLRPMMLANELTEAQWRVLRVLEVEDRIDTAKLARRSLLLGPSLSRVLKDLDARKLVVRVADDDDARRSWHSITKLGRSVIEQTAPQMEPLFDQLRSRMGVIQVRHLNVLLDELLAALDYDISNTK